MNNQPYNSYHSILFRGSADVLSALESRIVRNSAVIQKIPCSHPRVTTDLNLSTARQVTGEAFEGKTVILKLHCQVQGPSTMTQRLVCRKFCQAVCWIGVFQVLFGTCLALCGFIELGMFHNLSADGFWTGFPLLVPGFLAIVILATRRKEAVFPFFLTNVIVLILCIVHAALTRDEINHWKKYKDYVINGKCYERGDICSCPGDAQTKYYVQRCDLFSFGYDLYWAFVAFDIVGAVLSGFGAIAGLYGSCKETVKEEDDEPSI